MNLIHPALLDAILVLFVVLQILDAATTYAVIKRGGRELNPVLLWVQERLRPFTGARWAWLVIAKLMAIAVGAYLDHYNEHVVLAVATAVYLVIVIYNARQLSRM